MKFSNGNSFPWLPPDVSTKRELGIVARSLDPIQR